MYLRLTKYDLILHLFIFILISKTFLCISVVEEKRQPLWRRDMPGLKHIRGILYEEYPMGQIDESSGSTKNSFYQGKYRIRLGLNQFLRIIRID